jgi:Protein of unknown function (DUF2752)
MTARTTLHLQAIPDVWRNRLIVASPFLAMALLRLVTPTDDGPTFCPIALFTGVACPGCGMTRAAAALLKGDIAGAIRYHPLVFVVGAQLIAAWVWYLLRRSGKARPMSQAAVNVMLTMTLVLLVAVWVARLVAGTLPPV